MYTITQFKEKYASVKDAKSPITLDFDMILKFLRVYNKDMAEQDNTEALNFMTNWKEKIDDDIFMADYECVYHDLFYKELHPALLILLERESKIYTPGKELTSRFYLSSATYDFFSKEGLITLEEKIIGHDSSVYHEVGEVKIFSNKTMGLYSQSLIKSKSSLNPTVGTNVFSLAKFMGYLYPTYHVVFQDYKLDMDDAVVYSRDSSLKDVISAIKKERAPAGSNKEAIEAVVVTEEDINVMKKRAKHTLHALYDDTYGNNENISLAIAKVEALSSVPDYTESSEGRWSKNQALFMKHIAVMCMRKTFVNNEQIKEYVKCRLSTFKATVKALEITQDAAQYYTVEGIKMISTNMAFFLKFKQCIYNYTLLNRVRESTYHCHLHYWKEHK